MADTIPTGKSRVVIEEIKEMEGGGFWNTITTPIKNLVSIIATSMYSVCGIIQEKYHSTQNYLQLNLTNYEIKTDFYSKKLKNKNN